MKKCRLFWDRDEVPDVLVHIHREEIWDWPKSGLRAMAERLLALAERFPEHTRGYMTEEGGLDLYRPETPEETQARLATEAENKAREWERRREGARQDYERAKRKLAEFEDPA